MVQVGSGDGFEGAEHQHAGPVWVRTEEKTRGWIGFRTGAAVMDEVSGGEAVEQLRATLNQAEGYGVAIEGEAGVMNFL